MVIVQVCVGSSCHLKGSEELVELLQNKVKAERLEDDVILSGSFCTGRCNRSGVTVTVNDDVYTGVTPESFNRFFEEKIRPHIND